MLKDKSEAEPLGVDQEGSTARTGTPAHDPLPALSDVVSELRGLIASAEAVHSQPDGEFSDDDRIGRIRKVLQGFSEADALELAVFYRVSPRFIGDVRHILLDLAQLEHAYTLASTALLQMSHDEGYV